MMVQLVLVGADHTSVSVQVWTTPYLIHTYTDKATADLPYELHLAHFHSMQ